MRMGAIKKFFMAQLRKAPGEWFRGLLADRTIRWICGPSLTAKAFIVIGAALALFAGAWGWWFEKLRHDAPVATIVGLAIGIGIIIFLFLGAELILYVGNFRKRLLRETADIKSPLEIVFDVNNPGQRFWKRKQGKDAGGNFIPVMAVRTYRVGIRNNSANTVRNVRVSIETLGELPIDPRDVGFQKEKEHLDLPPQHIELVPVWWVWPPRAGDAWGPTATILYGPLRVIARGDDIYPAQADFDYFTEKMPVLVQRTTNDGISV